MMETRASLMRQKMIRQLNYRDHYFGNHTEHDARDLEVHISKRLFSAELMKNANLEYSDHCIEQLRQALMCQPDTSFTTFVWTHSDPKPVLDVRTFEKQCVDWDFFMERVGPRVVSFEEVDELVNPYWNSTSKDAEGKM